MKKKIKERLFIDSEEIFIEGPLINVLERIENILKYHGDDVEICQETESDYCYGSCEYTYKTVYNLYKYREETDKEYEKRLAREEKAKERAKIQREKQKKKRQAEKVKAEEKQRQLYEQLKKKYGE